MAIQRQNPPNIAAVRAHRDDVLGIDAGEEARRELLEDPMTEDAVRRRLETLSEATGRLSESLRERHPNIAWREITRFRNVLAHGYVHVDPELVWVVIREGIGPPKEAVQRELQEQGYLP